MDGRKEHSNKIETALRAQLTTMPDFMTGWYEFLIASRMQATSRRSFIAMIRKFLAYINKDVKRVKVEDITYEVTVSYWNSIRDKSYSYQNSIWFALNNFMGYMVDRGYIRQNYIAQCKRSKVKDTVKKTRLTEDDFHKLLCSVRKGTGHTAFRRRDEAIMLLFMTTGMRVEAMSEINIEDIDFDNQTLTVQDKEEKTHTFNLPDRVVSSIKLWLYEREDKVNDDTNRALFISQKRSRMSADAISDMVDKYAKESLGYHISPHKLRHGFCTILFNQGFSPAEVRDIVGHANIETTMRYYDADPKLRQNAANTIMSCIS